MIKKILFAVPFMTVLWLAPGAILAAEPASALEAVSSEECETGGQEKQEAGEEAVSGPAEEIKKRAESESGAAGGAAAESGQGEGTDTALLQQPTYTEEDLYVMAHVLAGESQNCPDEEQLYVGSVVLNRRAHPSFPGTVKGVVFQKGQYSCTRDGNYYREPTERNWANARRLLEEGSVLPGNVVWQSGKKQGSGVYVKTRWHYYCY